MKKNCITNTVFTPLKNCEQEENHPTHALRRTRIRILVVTRTTHLYNPAILQF